MSAFDWAFSIVVGIEGAFGADPRDRGNWTSGRIGEGRLLGTKWGISAAAFPSLDIPNLTLEEAKHIYREHYWDRISGDALPAAVALAVFDSAVNQGTNRAIRILQTALGVTVDGVLGPVTLSAAQRTKPDLFLERFLAERALAYTDVTTFPLYGRGWMRRLFKIAMEAVSGPETQ